MKQKRSNSVFPSARARESGCAPGGAASGEASEKARFEAPCGSRAAPCRRHLRAKRFALLLCLLSFGAAAVFGARAALHAKRDADAALLRETPASSLVERIAGRADRTSPLFIAHGGGAVGDALYTNSKESMRHAFEEGFRFIELDLRKTLTGEYYGGHTLKDFYRRTGHEAAWVLPPVSAASVRARRIEGRFTPVVLADLAAHLDEIPPFVLVVDKAKDYSKLLESFPHPERMIVEVSSLRQYAAALRAGVTTPALSTRRLRSAAASGVRAAVVNPQTLKNDPAAAQAFRKSGGIILTASVADCRDALADPLIGGLSDLVYADRCEALTARH